MISKLRALPYLLFLLPFDVIVALCLCVSVPLWLRKHRIVKTEKPDLLKTTIIIVNWDGKHLLSDCLPAVIEATKQEGGNHDILVVDNGSTDGSQEFIRQAYPCVRVLPLDRNYGFIGGNNRGIASVQTDTVVLLNNDTIVDRGFLRP